MILSFQGVTPMGHKLEVKTARWENLLELPNDDLADREPLFIRYSLGA